LDGTQRGIDGVRRRNIVSSLMKESSVTAAERGEKLSNSFLEILSISIDERLGTFVNQRNPQGVVLLWIRDINMFLRNQLPDCPDQPLPFILSEWQHCSVS